MKIEIFWDDLKPEKQKELFDAFGGENGNYDTFPIATIIIEDPETDKE